MSLHPPALRHTLAPMTRQTTQHFQEMLDALVLDIASLEVEKSMADEEPITSAERSAIDRVQKAGKAFAAVLESEIEGLG
jgi:hypothetical protein